jgi:hypothetical protein
MYAGVPSSEPVAVIPVSELGVLSGNATPVGSDRVDSRCAGRSTWASRASPKSVTTIRPVRLRSTLCGLKSRCTMPAAWAAASPRPAARNAAMISAGRRFAARSQSTSVSPWISSIAT